MLKAFKWLLPHLGQYAWSQPPPRLLPNSQTSLASERSVLFLAVLLTVAWLAVDYAWNLATGKDSHRGLSSGHVAATQYTVKELARLKRVCRNSDCCSRVAFAPVCPCSC